MAKILVTGGAGFIGTHIAERLVGRHQVILFDNLRRDSLAHAPSVRERATLISGDILDAAAIGQALEGVEIVLHLAAIAGVSSYYNEPLRTLQVNILGTAAVLEAATTRGVQRVIDFSTSETYGSDALWVDEASPHGIGPASELRWVYAASKLASEHLTLRYAEAGKFQATVIRPFNIYGPRQTGEGAVSNFARAAAAGEPLQVYGDGSAIRAWCYISDMVDAVEAILDTPSAAAGEIFNIGNPREIETTLGLARRVCELVPGAAIEHRDVARVEVRSRVPNIDKARRMLGFEPQVDLKRGLTETLAFFERLGTLGMHRDLPDVNGSRVLERSAAR